MDFANPVNASESSCDLLAATFGEPAEVTADVLNLRGAELSLYTIFRPACMHDGETFPVITWGNGTCGQSGGYAGLLATLASHGFVVIAANSRFTDAGNMEMLRALELAKSLNAQEGSVLYQRLNLEKIGAMGHSQGSSATANASSDPRIKSVILWNGGLSVTTKPFLAVSGDRDIGGYTPMQMDAAVQGSSLPAAFLYYKQVLETGGNVTGHLTLMEQPERVWEPTVAWWKYQLNGDEEAKKMFVGADCGLCNKPDELAFGANPSLK
jgi:predicted dienelactone hydrolase